MNMLAFDAAAWQRINSYFGQVLELAPDERDAWLTRLAITEPDVVATLRRLLLDLQALDGDSFLQHPPLANYADGLLPAGLGKHSALSPGSLVGPYRLIAEISEGGMSSVWLAERGDGQLKREVALKLPFLGPRMHIERFAHERDILAALTHPNIARLYDAGISESGQPYLAMEYVAGTALIRYCDERQLTTRERLLIFMQVLEAVQFAHSQLIVHRDLKPQNILVTPQGRVMLLDFGIGRLLTDRANEISLTQLLGAALTPLYASPEQIGGRALGPASDIYSLGVILYELLTGTRPHNPRYDSRASLEEAILQGELRRPSQQRLGESALALRRTTARALAHALTGDLDTIVLKALKTEPSERYLSAGAFAQDIANHLHNRPVSARPDSHWYRVGRFIARHKLTVATAATAFIALLVAGSMTVWQARAAQAERDRAVVLASRNAAVTEFLGRVITEAAASTKAVTVSELLARSEKLASTDTSLPPEHRAAVLEIIADRHLHADDVERASELFDRALAILDGSEDQSLRSRLTCAYAAANADAADIDSALSKISGELERLQSDAATASGCHLKAAQLLLHAHRGDEAIHHAQHGLRLLQGAHETAQPVAASLLSALAFGHHLVGRNRDAELYFSQAMQRFVQAGRERTDEALTAMNDWAVITHNAGAPRRALELYAQVLQIESDREAGNEPTTTTVGNHARALQSIGRFEEARAAYERECRLSVVRQDPYSELHCVLGLASLAVEIRAPDEAARHLRRSDELLNSSFPPESPPMLVRAVLQGWVALATGKLAEARTQFDRVIAQHNVNSIGVDAHLGKSATELAAKHFSEAAAEAQHALELATKSQAGLPYSMRTGSAWLALGQALQQSGARERAQESFQNAIEQLSNTVDADHPRLLEAQRRLRDSVT